MYGAWVTLGVLYNTGSRSLYYIISSLCVLLASICTNGSLESQVSPNCFSASVLFQSCFPLISEPSTSIHRPSTNQYTRNVSTRNRTQICLQAQSAGYVPTQQGNSLIRESSVPGERDNPRQILRPPRCSGKEKKRHSHEPRRMAPSTGQYLGGKAPSSFVDKPSTRPVSSHRSQRAHLSERNPPAPRKLCSQPAIEGRSGRLLWSSAYRRLYDVSREISDR